MSFSESLQLDDEQMFFSLDFKRRRSEFVLLLKSVSSLRPNALLLLLDDLCERRDSVVSPPMDDLRRSVNSGMNKGNKR